MGEERRERGRRREPGSGKERRRARKERVDEGETTWEDRTPEGRNRRQGRGDGDKKE